MKFLRVVQIGGIVFFVLVVFITILFAEGYQFDPGSRELVKKSVVLFEKIPRGASVTVDGKTETAMLSGELRLPPGNHDIEIKKTGAASWKKRVKVPEDTVVRFPEIVLLPVNGAANFINIQESRTPWRLQSVSHEGVLLANFNLHFQKFIPFDSPKDFSIFDIIPTAPSKKLIVKEQYKDTVPAGKKLFGLDGDGKVWDISAKDSEDMLEPELYFNLPQKASAFLSAQEADDFFLFLFLGEPIASRSTRARLGFLVLTDASGAILFQEMEVFAASLGKQELFYATRNKFISYDFREKKIVKEIPLAKPVRWFSRIGNTFHFLFLNESGELSFCDEDAENCVFFAKGVAEIPAVSQNKEVFFVPFRDTFTWFDFGEDAQTLPTLLNDLVSSVF